MWKAIHDDPNNPIGAGYIPDDYIAFKLEEKYGQPPGSSENWNDKVFEKAWRYHIAENREKWPAESVPAERKAQMKNEFILDRNFDFWKRFVVNGMLDTEAIVASGYSDEQIHSKGGILEQMMDNGWLAYEGEGKGDTPPHKIAHVYQDANGWCRVCGKSAGYPCHTINANDAPTKALTTRPLNADNADVVLQDDDIEIDVADEE